MPDACLTAPEAFDAIVRRNPAAPAVCVGDMVLSYGELDRRARHLAGAIVAAGAGPKRIVALHLPRSAGLIVAVLAVARAGAAYVPLDTNQPAARTEFMIGDCGAVVTIGGPGSDAGLIVDPDTGWADLPADAAPRDKTALGPDDLAYAIYTSGSTGTPKAVAVTHANLMTFIRAAGELPLGPGCQVLHLAAPAFDASVLEVWGTLLHGGCIVVAPPGLSAVARIGGLIAEQRVDTAFFTAGLFRALAETDPGAFAGMRVAMTGGDVVSPAAARAVLAACPSLTLLNCYGPTETVVFALWHTVRAEDLNGARLPIGRALPGYSVSILDAWLRPVGAGETGEICIAGGAVARGYLGRPALTDEHFVTVGPGRRLYRTGDLGFWNDNGTVDFRGRIDRQIKLRGFRIEPSEIEAAMLGEASVGDAVVIARAGLGEKRLFAYAVPRGGGAGVDLDAVRMRLRDTLPPYMLPSAYTVIDAIPLTPNGKLDRDALPDPDYGVGPEEAPDGVDETMVADIFAAITGRGAVGRHTDFFDLGGDSLDILRLVAELERATGALLPIGDVLADLTPAGIAASLRQRSEWSPLLPLRASGTRPPLFCLHPGTGVGLAFRSLLDVLDRDQPLFALQARGLEQPAAAHRSVAAMAAAYRQAIETVQPRGPYRLLGWSLGGTIAHEMTCQWERDGQAVDLLAMLDAGVPAYAMLDAAEEVRGLSEMLRRMSGLAPEARARRARLLVWALHQRDLVPADTPPAWAENMVRQLEVSRNMLAGHSPGVCAADILMLRAADTVATAPEWGFAWEPYTAGVVRRVTLPGKHNSLVEPAVASRIAAALALG